MKRWINVQMTLLSGRVSGSLIERHWLESVISVSFQVFVLSITSSGILGLVSTVRLPSIPDCTVGIKISHRHASAFMSRLCAWRPLNASSRDITAPLLQVKTAKSTQSTSGIVGIFVNIRWLHGEQTPQKYFKCNHYISSSQRKTNTTKMNVVKTLWVSLIFSDHHHHQNSCG